MKKRLFCLLIAFLALTLPAAAMRAETPAPSHTASAAKEDILVVKGKHLPILYFDGHPYLSLNALCRVLGETKAKFWIEKEIFHADIQKGKLHATAVQGEHLVIANGRYLYSDCPNVYQNRVLYVPMASAVKAVGAEIERVKGKYHYLKANDDAAIVSAENYYDADSVFWLGRIIQAESGNQPLAGKIAVGTVVMNRVASPEYPSTIYGVIFDRKYGVQFTPTANGSIYCTPTDQSLIAAKIVLDGYRTDPDILFFMNEATATSKWIFDNCEYAFTIADHSFWS